MDKGLYLLLNSKSRKGTKKPAGETKTLLGQPHKLSVPQSTKGASDPSISSIPTYRLMQYVPASIYFP